MLFGWPGQRERRELIMSESIVSIHLLGPLHLQDQMVVAITIQVLDSLVSILSACKTHKGKAL